MQWPGALCLYVSREERGAALGVERSQQQAICLMARNSDRYWVHGAVEFFSCGSRGVPVLVPVRASPVPSAVRDQTSWCGVT